MNWCKKKIAGTQAFVQIWNGSSKPKFAMKLSFTAHHWVLLSHSHVGQVIHYPSPHFKGYIYQISPFCWASTSYLFCWVAELTHTQFGLEQLPSTSAKLWCLLLHLTRRQTCAQKFALLSVQTSSCQGVLVHPISMNCVLVCCHLSWCANTE